MRVLPRLLEAGRGAEFPFLFGGTFIEGKTSGTDDYPWANQDFPSFSEGLSLRVVATGLPPGVRRFPFLFGGTFIEGWVLVRD